jgi:serine/threonine-protein kinase
MGKVYLARRSGQAGFERYFAIKVMSHQLSEDRDALLMLLDEAHIASRLHHPNVVSVNDIGTYDDGYYLVMDYVEGCTVQQLLQRNPSYRPPRLIVPILMEALRGLHAVHTLRDANNELYGVVHRDVSPHNLLLGIDGACRVTDFGIAKARERFTDTQAGVYKGKLAYMSPEQLRGAHVIDQRADIWAAGVTLYTALTGDHPFRSTSDASTLHNVLTGELVAPSRVGLKPPASLDAAVMKALARDPDERYASAHDFEEALREVAMAEGLLGSHPEVAAWVQATYGAELVERRKRVAELPKAESETPNGGMPSLPRLWFAGDTTNAATGSGSGRQTVGPWNAPRSSWTVTALERPQALARLGLVVLAIAIGGFVALINAKDEPIEAAAAPTLPSVEESKQTETAAARGEPRETVTVNAAPPLALAPEAGTASRKDAGVKAAQPERTDSVVHGPASSAARRGRVTPAPRAREQEQQPQGRSRAERASEKGQHADERANALEQAPAAPSTPSAVEPAPAARPIERNPYMLGE